MNRNILSQNDLNKLCRICMKISSNTYGAMLDVRSICDGDEQLDYLECLYRCTKIDLRNDYDDDVLPQNLCRRCCWNIKYSYKFYKTVEQSIFKIDDYIKTLRSQSKTQQYQSVLLPEKSGLSNQSMEKEEALLFCKTQVENLNTDESYDSYIIEDGDVIIEEYLDDNFQVTQSNENGSSEIYLEVCEDFQQPNKELRKIESNKVDLLIQKEIPDTMKVYTVIEEVAEDDEIQENDIVEEDNCPDITITQATRIRHVGSYSCNICKKIFPNYSRMSIHRRSHESNRLKYLCPHCNRIYCTKQALDTHIQGVHKKTGYTCSICMKLFAIKKNLEIHMRYHTGDFPYECEVCNRKFAQIGHLNTHRNVKHNNVRFGCEYPNCGKYFTSSNSLRHHEFSHGVMPFECTLCQRGFPAKAKLRVHLKRKHDQDFSKEELEDMRKFYVVRSKVNTVKLIGANDYI